MVNVLLVNTSLNLLPDPSYVYLLQSSILLVARQSHLSGCFLLFAPKYWEVEGTYKLSFFPKRNVAFELNALAGCGDTKIFRLPLAPEC